MAVRKRTGFKVQKRKSSTRLEAANKRLASANARIKAANAQTKAAKARSKAAKVRIKVAKKKIQKIKSKSKARKIQTQRGVIKARGGGPARPASKLQGQLDSAIGGFMNPFPEAAAFQNPFTLGWRVLKGAKVDPKTGRQYRTAHTETTLTKGEVEIFEGGQPGILGMPVGTGQKDITFVKSGDKIVKKVGKKTYTKATGGDVAYSMEPNVFLKEEGGEDFTAASAWWSDYTKLTVAGKTEKGKGQPGYGKGGVGPSEAQKDQPGWYMKPKAGQGEFKVSGPAGGYRVLAGKGKTKTWAGGSTRIEAGAQPGGKWAFEKWFKFLTPEKQTEVKKTFLGGEGLYRSTLDAERAAKYGGKATKTAKVTSASLAAAVKGLSTEVFAKALKMMPEGVQKDVGRFGKDKGLTFKNKEKLLGYAAEEK